MASHPEFNSQTTADEVAAAFGSQIQGKTVVVTGVGPSSIGSTTALAIASKSPSMLILASRTESKLQAVAVEIKKKYPHVIVKTVLLDLASLDSVKAAASQVVSLTRQLDVLINNAGCSLGVRYPTKTPGGTVVDKQFFTNHLGTFLFTSLLLPSLAASGKNSAKGETRVVNLSSQGHRLSPIRFHDYQFALDAYDSSLPELERAVPGLPPKFTRTVDGFPGFLAYGQSKTANLLHAMELSKRLRSIGTNVVAFAVHPGSVDTELSRDLDKEGKATIDGILPKEAWKNLEQGSSTTLVAAFDPALSNVDVGDGTVSGYMTDCQLADDGAAAHGKDLNMSAKLWDESETMLKIKVL
ncbi:hypothetical protein MKZ38_007215 [Zalerion maritima]|uniref:Uncharacterized protein n=1 Tax=Zalerion maritima TaxID=339359 RepID=A0AAD5RIN8_9PEZI|nr:hypothetical protein MKZ38_007215 [Zalerion maritima]